MKPLSERIHVETRSAEQAESRAIVIDYGTARWFLGVLMAAAGLVAGAAWWTADTVSDITARVANVEAQVGSLGDRIGTVDEGTSKKIEIVNDNASKRIDALEQRVRPIEITNQSVATSLSFIRDGVGEIGDRLDRIENRIGNGSRP